MVSEREWSQSGLVPAYSENIWPLYGILLISPWCRLQLYCPSGGGTSMHVLRWWLISGSPFSPPSLLRVLTQLLMLLVALKFPSDGCGGGSRTACEEWKTNWVRSVGGLTVEKGPYRGFLRLITRSDGSNIAPEWVVSTENTTFKKNLSRV